MKRLVYFLAPCLLSACGWSPMYSDNLILQNRVADIYIAPIAGTNGIDLRNSLILSWNTSNDKSAKYRLSVKLNEPQTIYKALQRSGDATWDEVRITASWTLSEGENIIAKSSETASESYAFVSDLVSASASKTSAIEHAIHSVAEKIELKVNAKLKDLAKYE
ncbi:MAG: hypothetical protein LBD94_00565 [Rickettsiales bacterium]|jgi:hypothetical protein|nr:hypothetical protein [Rickettsiales bacterium]